MSTQLNTRTAYPAAAVTLQRHAVTAVVDRAAIICARQSHNVGINTTGHAQNATTSDGDELLARLMQLLSLVNDTNVTIRLQSKRIALAGCPKLYGAAQSFHAAWLTKWSQTKELEILIP